MSVAGATATPESVVPDQTGLPDEITLALGGEQTLLLPSSAGKMPCSWSSSASARCSLSICGLPRSAAAA